MVQTRARSHKGQDEEALQIRKPLPKKALQKPPPRKRKSANPEPDSTPQDAKIKKLKSKRSRASDSRSTAPKTTGPTLKEASLTPLISHLLTFQSQSPLSDFSIPYPLKPTSSTALLHILSALLSSARISHTLASQTLHCLVRAGFCDLAKLKNSTWQERTEVLTEGGYTRYREKTATALGEVADLITNKYSGDAAQIVLGNGNDEDGLAAEEKREKVRERLTEMKGLGPLGVELFFETAQAVWPSLAPFVGERDLKALREMGIQDSVESIYEGLGRDAVVVARLCAAVAKVRLERKMEDLIEISRRDEGS